MIKAKLLPPEKIEHLSHPSFPPVNDGIGYTVITTLVKCAKDVLLQERSQDIHLGGGGAQKIMCPQAHYQRGGTELTFGRPGGRLRALEALELL